MADKEIASFSSELGGQIVILADTVTGLVTGFRTWAGTVSLASLVGGLATLAAASDYNANLVTPLAAAQNTANAALPAAQKGAALGVATLDGSSHIPMAQIPVALVGGVNWQGTYNAATNTPALVAGNKGFMWTVAAAGTSLGFTWVVGDKVMDNGTAFEKIDGTPNEVVSVAGRSGPVVLASADLSDLAAVITGPIAANTAALTVQSDNGQIGTAYTLALSDAGQNVDMNNAAANTLTIPPNSSVAFPVGTIVTVTMAGAGITTIAPGAGVTIVKPTSRTLSISAQYETAQLYKVGADTWRALVG